MNPLLHVEHLCATISTKTGKQALVNDVTFDLAEGSVLAIVGESGSGKTTLSRALTRLFPPSFPPIVSGIVRFRETDLLTCDKSSLQRIRQKEIRYVFQEPQQALNPVAPIRKQLKSASGNSSSSETVLLAVLKSVGLDNAEEVLHLYPHQLSIGMAQRVMIAMALLPEPSLLIADEPTSAVDASLRYRLLELLKSHQEQRGTAMILVTHDFDVAKRFADDVAVLRAGTFIEQAACAQFFRAPQHPYSRQLLEAIPSAIRRQPTEPA